VTISGQDAVTFDPSGGASLCSGAASAVVVPPFSRRSLPPVPHSTLVPLTTPTSFGPPLVLQRLSGGSE